MPAGELNKRMVESLIKAGTFDRLGVFRSRLLAVYERLLEQVAEKGRNKLDGQLDMFSMLGGENLAPAPTVAYPELPELGVREKLMLEKDATGMYFSGNMLDEYSKHLDVLKVDSISDFVGEDADPVDKARVSFAGMITSVTAKTTKSGERMAFFTLEDRLAEIECLVFARKYADVSYLIRNDIGVFVSGTLSVREDEPPKLLLNNIEELIENKHFTKEKAQRIQEETAKAAFEAPRAEPAQVSAVPSQGRQTEPSKAPRRLFLRVSSQTNTSYLKARNLAELFDGSFPVFFYYADEKRYERDPIGVAVSEYVLRQFRELLGEENVILQ